MLEAIHLEFRPVRSAEQQRDFDAANKVLQDMAEKVTDAIEREDGALIHKLLPQIVPRTNALDPSAPPGPIDYRYQAVALGCARDDQKQLRTDWANLLADTRTACAQFPPHHPAIRPAAQPEPVAPPSRALSSERAPSARAARAVSGPDTAASPPTASSVPDEDMAASVGAESDEEEEEVSPAARYPPGSLFHQGRGQPVQPPAAQRRAMGAGVRPPTVPGMRRQHGLARGSPDHIFMPDAQGGYDVSEDMPVQGYPRHPFARGGPHGRRREARAAEERAARAQQEAAVRAQQERAARVQQERAARAAQQQRAEQRRREEYQRALERQRRQQQAGFDPFFGGGGGWGW